MSSCCDFGLVLVDQLSCHAEMAGEVEFVIYVEY